MQCTYSNTRDVTHIRCELGDGKGIGANFQKDEFCVVFSYKGDNADFEADYDPENGLYVNRYFTKHDDLTALMIKLMDADTADHVVIMRDLADLIA